MAARPRPGVPGHRGSLDHERPGLGTYTENTAPGDHSTENVIKVGSYDGTDKADSFLQFPGSGLDGSKATISSATLNLFDTWASTCTPERFDVAAVSTAWTPSTVTSYPGPPVRDHLDRQCHAERAGSVREYRR